MSFSAGAGMRPLAAAGRTARVPRGEMAGEQGGWEGWEMRRSVDHKGDL